MSRHRRGPFLPLRIKLLLAGMLVCALFLVWAGWPR
jgi:hypothetical protein